MIVTTGGYPYAIGSATKRGFGVHCIRFGLLAASAERRPEEEIRAVKLDVAAKASKPVAVTSRREGNGA
jgi:hypothetical protein